MKLVEQGILEKHGVEMIGAKYDDPREKNVIYLRVMAGRHRNLHRYEVHSLEELELLQNEKLR